MKFAISKSVFESTIRNERGVLTLDFMFAFVFAFGFSMVLFAMSITLASVEVSQYITFAVSRSYAGAHESPSEQSSLANQKFAELMEKGVFKAFYSLGLVKLGPPQLGDFSSEYPQESLDGVFVGVRMPMDARITHISIPGLGNTADNSSVGKAVLNSYLMREVSSSECREKFNRERGNRIRQMQAGSGNPYANAPEFHYALITDNGC